MSIAGIAHGIVAGGIAVCCVFSASDAKAQAAVTEASPSALAFNPGWALQSTSELSFTSFRGSRGYPVATAPFLNSGSGSQKYLETSYALSGNPSELFKLEFLLKSGYVRSEQTTGGFFGRYQGSTDTIFSTTATYLGLTGIQPYISLNFNLPTGKAALFGFGGRARLDPDLVPVPTFGEGFNFGPTIGVNIPIGDTLMFNVSGGVTVREAYYREGQLFAGNLAQLSSKYTPGTLMSASTSLTYTEGQVSAQGSATFSTDTTAFIDNIATSRSGNRVTFSLSTSYAFTDTLLAAFSGTASFASPNNVVRPDVAVPVSAIFPNGAVTFPNGVLTQEEQNSNSKTFQGRLSLTYAFTPGFSLTPFVSVLTRDKNSFDSVRNVFTPAKDRYSVGTTARYAIADNIALTGRVEYIHTYERGTPPKFDPLVEAFAPGTGFMANTFTVPLSFNALQVAAGVNFTF